MGNAIATVGGSSCEDLQDGLNDIVDMTLGIDSTRDREANEFHGCGDFFPRIGIALPEHH